MTSKHVIADIDDLVHQRVRLGILTVLSEVRRVDFTYLRDALDLTDGNLSRHMEVLSVAGYVRIAKTFEGKRPRTWISVTPAGKRALASEIAALRDIVSRFEVTTMPQTQDA